MAKASKILFKEYLITEEFNNVRLDKWFRNNIQNFPQSFIEKLLRSKKVIINNQTKISANFRLTENDVIQIDTDLIAEKEERKILNIDKKYIDLVKNNIIFEDNNIIIINKIAKLAVQGGSKIRLSIDDILPHLGHFNQIKLVHRLDKDTSGILLLAKNNNMARILSEAFKNKKIRKIYQAILTNIPKNKKGIIDNFVKKMNINGKERMVICDEIQGGRAITSYKILKILKNNHCLVEFIPITGRTHQLRLHAETLNCPILGDRKYGLDIVKNSEKIDNLFLHAKSVDLSKIFDKINIIETDLPSYFEDFIKNFT